MGLLDVYQGRQSWTDFVSGQMAFTALEGVLPRLSAADSADQSKELDIGLSAAERQVALDSGLGALSPERLARARDHSVRLGVGLEKLAGGLERLKADFNLLLADIAWRLEMQQETSANILEELRLAEFEREARAY